MDPGRKSRWGREDKDVYDQLRWYYEENESGVYFLTRDFDNQEEERSEGSGSKVFFICETNDKDTTSQSSSELNNDLEMATLRDQVCTILNAEDGIYENRQIINNLAFYFETNDFPTDINGHWTVQWHLVQNIIEKLILKSDNIEQSMAFLSGISVRVLCRLAKQKSPVAPGVLKWKLIAFVDAIGKIVKNFDHEAWRTWFSGDCKYTDWILFTASVFMPQGAAYVGKDEPDRVKNALEFFDKVRHNRQTNQGDKSKKTPSPVMPDEIDDGATSSGQITQKRKFQENDHGGGEEEEKDEKERQQRRKRTKTNEKQD